MKKDILVIDDSKSIRFLLHTALKKQFNVTSVADGMSALYCLRKGGLPDLIIIDPELDDFPDWELVRYLHTSPAYSAIPVLVIHGKDSEEMRAKCMQFGVMECFSKPFHPQQLTDAVEDILMGRYQDKIY